MFDEHDPETGFAVGFALAVAIFVALFTIGVALFVISVQRPTAAAAAAARLAPIKVYFGAGEALLPAEAGARLASLIAVAHADAGRKIVISGYHDQTGDPSFNAELARQRAYVVRDFFRAAGIADDRLMLDKPQETTGGADDREARRVEVMLQ
jgi:outer membrane protein OmpA-like peptidoglycan-associated protein